MTSQSKLISSLNPEQKAAVTNIDGPLLVLAGAGSGKTRVITRKIAWLIGECDVPGRAIAAVTFTNKAAREMKSRVGELVRGNKGRGLTVSTFHTLGLRILQAEHREIGYKKGFTIFDAEDARGLIKELLKGEKRDLNEVIDRCQGRISGWKSDMVDPEEAIRIAEDADEARAARVYIQYEKHLRAYNAVDFDDLICRPVRLFRDNPEILERWQNRFRYLLVDEYQDTNGAQYLLLKLLAGPRGAFTVVGDDDQSVYAWRGARPENLARLKEDFPTLKVVKLEQNYRSTSRILRVANTLIGNNPHVFEKRLWSERGEGEPLRVLSCGDAFGEAERVVAELLQKKMDTGSEWHDFAILYRSNHQSRLFERALREQRIPYHLSGGTSFFDRGEVKDVVAYLRLMANPDDDAAFLRIINVPRREIGPVTLEKLGSYAGQRSISLFSACFEMGLMSMLPDRAVQRLQQFAEWLSRKAEHAENGDPVEISREVLDDIDYRGWLDDVCRDAKTAEKRWENIEELFSWMTNIRKKEDNEADRKGLGELLRHMSIMDLLDKNRDEAADCVHLMTLHGAKGLEFPWVYMVGMEEEILPHRNNLEGEGLEEERRLCYVGITRAQRGLTMTYAAKRKRYGEELECEPSRFLAELPEDDLDWPGVKREVSEEEKLERGRAALSSLRGLLADT